MALQDLKQEWMIITPYSWLLYGVSQRSTIKLPIMAKGELCSEHFFDNF